MRQLLFGLVITLFLLSALPVVMAGQLAQENDPESIAQSLVDNLIAGDYAAAGANFSPEVSTALPPEILQQAWEQIQAQVGLFQEQLGRRVDSQSEQGTLVIITLRFEKMALDVKVNVDGSGQVSGLFFSPAAANSFAYEAPDYVDESAFTEQDVTVGSGDWALPGTLTLPVGEGPFPAVVLVHGSGPNDRDESAGPNKPFRDIAWGLASNGIAVLRYDKRTLVHGQRLAELVNFTLDDETVADALLAVELLKQTEGIDPARIVVAGHSLGGYAIPRIAAGSSDLAGVIILAGNSRPLPDLVVEQVNYLAALDGKISVEEQAELTKIEDQARMITFGQPPEMGEGLFAGPASYWLDLIAYDPVAMARNQTVPLLILQGERDYQVTMEDFEGWRNGLADRDNVRFVSFPALNHHLIAGEGPASPDEYQTVGHVDENVILTIVDWIDETTQSN